MNKMMTAIALAIALPSVANAQAAPAPAPKAEQGHTMMHCKGMAGSGHAGHQMPGHGAHQMPGHSGQHMPGETGHAGHGAVRPGANAPAAGHQHNQQQ